MGVQPTRSYTRLAMAIVLAAVLVSATLFIAISGATKTLTSTFTTASTFTTTVYYGGAELVGTCGTDNYLVPNTVQSSSVVTATSDGSTSIYTTYYSLTTIYLGGSSYATSIYANTTGTLVVRSTTTWYSSPSAGGVVTVCTFSG